MRHLLLSILLVLAGTAVLCGQPPADLKRAKPPKPTATARYNYTLPDKRMQLARDTQPFLQALNFKPLIISHLKLAAPPAEGYQLPPGVDPLGADLTHPVVLANKIRDPLHVELVKLMGLYGDQLYPDLNPKTGIFYYLPKAFNLDFDHESGTYGYDIRYREGDQSGGPVRLQVRFSTSMDEELLEMLTRMIPRPIELYPPPVQKALQKDRRQAMSMTIKELPLEGTPRVNLPFTANQVDESQVSTQEFSDLGHPFSVQWAMNHEDATEFVGATAASYEFNGTMEMVPAGAKGQSHELPIELSLVNPAVIGPLRYNNLAHFRIAKLRNNSRLRLAVKAIYVLAPRSNEKLILLEKLEPVGAFLEPGQDNQVLDREVQQRIMSFPSQSRVLITLEVAECEGCDRKAKESVLKPLTVRQDKEVTFLEIGAFDTTKAVVIELVFDDIHESYLMERGPEKLTKVSVPVDLTGKPRYRYKVKLAFSDGSRKESQWIVGDEPSVYVNPEFIVQHFPEFGGY